MMNEETCNCPIHAARRRERLQSVEEIRQAKEKQAKGTDGFVDAVLAEMLPPKVLNPETWKDLGKDAEPLDNIAPGSPIGDTAG